MEHVEILGRVYPINQTIDLTRLIRRSQARSLGSSRARLTVFGKIYEESFRRRRSTDVVGKQRNSFDVATSTMQRGSEKHLCFPLRGRAKPFFFCVHLYLPYLLFPRFQVFLRSIEFFSISIRFFPLCLYILFFPFLFLSFFLSFCFSCSLSVSFSDYFLVSIRISCALGSRTQGISSGLHSRFISREPRSIKR